MKTEEKKLRTLQGSKVNFMKVNLEDSKMVLIKNLKKELIGYPLRVSKKDYKRDPYINSKEESLRAQIQATKAMNESLYTFQESLIKSAKNLKGIWK